MTLEARIKAALATFGVADTYVAGLRYDDPAPGRQWHTSKVRDVQLMAQGYEGERR